jgi:hypothetical protein
VDNSAETLGVDPTALGLGAFSTKMKTSPPLTQKQPTHYAYIETTKSGKASAMNLFPINQLSTTICHPDIFSLLLT